MIKKLILVAFASTAFALGACASDGGASNDAFAKQVADAKSSIKELKADEALWRDTEKFLKQAEEAQAAGDSEKANKMLKKVQFEIDAARKQFESQKDAGPTY
jgi:formate-dependent nitrite reductase cytochrome c552 subunit